MTDAPRLARGTTAWWAAIAVLWFVTGCGYQTTELYPERYQTVAAPIFENRTGYRGVENDLAEALIKEIEQQTPYKVVATPRAQTVLSGVVTGMEQKTLSRARRGGLPQELEVTLTIDYAWRDLSTGEVLRERRGFRTPGRYRPTAPVSERFETGQHAAVAAAARAVVATMREGF